MSIEILSRVWANPPCSGSKLLVLLALADNANDDNGCAWPSIATLARKAAMSERSVQRALRGLEDEGLVRVVRPGGRRPDGSYVTTIWAVLQGRQIDAPENARGDTTGSSGATPVSPKPSKGTVMGRERAPAPVDEVDDVPFDQRWKISSKPVRREPWLLTARVLAEFNRCASRKLRLVTSAGQPSEAAKRVYGRIVLYPDIDFEQHADIIRRTLISRWWGEGPPGIGVVFGPKVFEDNITREAKASAKAARADSRDAKKQRAAEDLAAIQRIIGGDL